MSQISQKNTVLESLFLDTPTQVFHCEICEIFRNIYFEEHLRTKKCGLIFTEIPEIDMKHLLYKWLSSFGYFIFFRFDLLL